MEGGPGDAAEEARPLWSPPEEVDVLGAVSAAVDNLVSPSARPCSRGSI